MKNDLKRMDEIRQELKMKMRTLMEENQKLHKRSVVLAKPQPSAIEDKKRIEELKD